MDCISFERIFTDIKSEKSENLIENMEAVVASEEVANTETTAAF